jgi:prepilin peptidase CpaA
MSGLLATLLECGGLGGLVLAAGADVRARIIPNELVVWVMSMGLASRLLTDGWASWVSVLAAAALFLALGLLVSREVIGGGDSKMIAAATLLVEPTGILRLLLAIVMSGGILALAYLAASYPLKARLARQGEPSGGRAKPPDLIDCEVARIAARESMPYGVAILAGSAFVLFR